MSNCPVCKTPGKLIKDYKRLIHYECPRCGKDWVTLSK